MFPRTLVPAHHALYVLLFIVRCAWLVSIWSRRSSGRLDDLIWSLLALLRRRRSRTSQVVRMVPHVYTGLLKWHHRHLVALGVERGREPQHCGEVTRHRSQKLTATRTRLWVGGSLVGEILFLPLSLTLRVKERRKGRKGAKAYAKIYLYKN